jgi:hypothetical protein
LHADYSGDGVHPNKLGYQVMAPLAEKAIVEVLGQKLDYRREIHNFFVAKKIKGSICIKSSLLKCKILIMPKWLYLKLLHSIL